MQKNFVLIAVFCILVGLSGQAAYGVQYFDSFTNFSAGSYPIGIASADFNGDTIPDLATANNQGNSVSVLLGNGNGTFATRTNYSTGAALYPYYVATGDMDGDGNIDIVSGGSLGFVIFYGVGDGTFGTAEVHNIGQQVLDLVVADFDKDLDLDIVTSHAVRDSVGVHLNNGDSTYTSHMVATGQGTTSLATGYLDGDTYLDVLVGCNQGTVWNLKNDQAGSFIPTEVHIGLLNDPAAVAVADIDGDNIDDFIVTHAVNDFLFTYFNNGDGTYSVGVGHVLTDNPIHPLLADVDEDGDEDALVCIGTTDEIEFYLNDGAGAFTYDSAYSTGGTPKDVVFEDLNDDGHKDLAVASYTTDAAVVLMNRMSLILDVDESDTGGGLPAGYSLEQNYPNPFNPETHIRFSLPEKSHVKVEVFNVLGQSVVVLVDDELTPGLKEITWNGENTSGQKVASGAYLYRITTDRFVDTKTMVLLK